MTEESGIMSVNAIANDDNELIKYGKKILGRDDIVLDADWTTGKNFERLDPSVCAVLVKPGAGGAVRVFSDPIIKNVVTNDLDGFVMIPVKTGELCRLFGSPSVRFFRAS